MLLEKRNKQFLHKIGGHSEKEKHRRKRGNL